jgi:NADPH:quinone reductase-like Zn-dependent oxidoreductase
MLKGGDTSLISWNHFFHLGMEAIGVAMAVGPGLTGRKVGDVVMLEGLWVPTLKSRSSC